MTKQELSQLYYLNREIEQLKKQVADVESIVQEKTVADSVSGSSPTFPYTMHTIKITGIDYKGYQKRVKRLRGQLALRLEELIDKAAEINDYISTVDSSEMRQILALRYVNGLNWDEIGRCMSYATVTIKRKHNFFMRIER